MSEQKVYLDDIYASEMCGGSAFKAVVLMAHEARFLNEQERLGYIEMDKKPTTIAMDKFKQDRLQMEEITDDVNATSFYDTAKAPLAVEKEIVVLEEAPEVIGEEDVIV